MQSTIYLVTILTVSTDTNPGMPEHHPDNKVLQQMARLIGQQEEDIEFIDGIPIEELFELLDAMNDKAHELYKAQSHLTTGYSEAIKDVINYIKDGTLPNL